MLLLLSLFHHDTIFKTSCILCLQLQHYAYMAMRKLTTVVSRLTLLVSVPFIRHVSARIEHSCTCSTVQDENTGMPHVIVRVSENKLEFKNK